jgi:outer membrane biosynthesis protein TonB
VSDAARERVGLATSLVVHGLLALILLLVTLDLKPFQLEFTMISFSTAGAGEPSAKMSGGFRTEQPMIELPRRPMLDETSPLLKLPEETREAVEPVPPQERLDLTDVAAVTPRSRGLLTAMTPGKRERAEIKPLEVGNELMAAGPPDLLGQSLTGDEMFSVSWEGTPRTKISGELPKFPAGVDRGATVNISFTVAPDGAVVFVAPAAKGLPQMEKAAMDALRGWRFNALEKSQSQVNQKGVAIFVFQLR